MPRPCECFLCRQTAEASDTNDLSDKLIECGRCGYFRMSKILQKIIANGTPIAGAYLLSGFTREQTELDYDPPQFDDHEKAEKLALSLPRGIADRAQKILLAILRKTKYFGHGVTISFDRDYPLGYAFNSVEFSSLLDYLVKRDFIKLVEAMDDADAFLTANGYAEIENRRKNNAESEKVFVAMWFDPQMESVYETAIAPGIRDAGFRPIRIDLQEFNDDVVARILAEIRESRFVVSDFTGNRNGVYFETGFGMGLGLPVIWLCHKDHIREAHFDTNHFNHIAWENPDELRERLTTRIKATIGLGPVTG